MNIQKKSPPVLKKTPVFNNKKKEIWSGLFAQPPLSVTAETQNGHQCGCEQHAEHKHEQIL